VGTTVAVTDISLVITEKRNTKYAQLTATACIRPNGPIEYADAPVTQRETLKTRVFRDREGRLDSVKLTEARSKLAQRVIRRLTEVMK